MRTEDKGYSREGSTSLVRKLQVPHLGLEATSILRKVETSVSQPLDIPTPKRAVPGDAGHTNHFDDRAGMGTVRTFPVRSSAAAKRPAAGAVGTNKRSRQDCWTGCSAGSLSGDGRNCHPDAVPSGRVCLFRGN